MKSVFSRLTRNWSWAALLPLLLFLLWSRFWALDQLPATLPHDESVYAVQAQSYALQGTSLDQTQPWWSLNPTHPMYAEWPALVMFPGFIVSDDALFATHFSSAVMGVTLPFIVGSIVHSLWKRRDVTWATIAVVSLNPLMWQMSRLSYDAVYSLWFYLAGAALLLRRTWLTTLLCVPVFVVGFFQYQGFKLLLLPWVLFLLTLVFVRELSPKFWQRPHWKALWQTLWQVRMFLVVAFGALLLSLYYGLVLLPKQSAAIRLSSTIFTDSQRLSDLVNAERRLSTVNPFSSLVSNKATAVVGFMLERLNGVFDPDLLFRLVEPNRSGFSVWTHGIFYWVDVVLFGVGIAALIGAKKFRLSGIVWAVGILTFCLPALINTGDEWYVLRSMMSYTLILPVLGCGLATLWRQGFWWRLGVGAVLLVSVLNFSYHYWTRYPIISLDWGNFDERVIARYVSLHESQFPDVPITVYSDEPEFLFWSYLYYSNALTRENAGEVGQAMRDHPPYKSRSTYTVGSITFTGECAPREPSSRAGVKIIRQLHARCSEDHERELQATNVSPVLSVDPSVNSPVLSISAVLDSGERFRIYGNRVCQAQSGSYIHVQRLSDLNIEEHSPEEFCGRWILDVSALSGV